jgi:purine-binding chemotaxis protein CheW
MTLIDSTERAVLVARATELARRGTAATTGEMLNLVAFRAGAGSFSIETRYVRDVIRLRQLSPVPGAPHAVLGVTTHQGEIIAVVDILSALGIDAVQLRDAHWLILLGVGSVEFGVTADEILGSVDIAGAELLSPERSSDASSVFIKAVTSSAIALLDGDALLKSEQFFRPSAGARAVALKDEESHGHEKESTT